MRGFILSSLIILFNNITLQNQIEAGPTLNAYMNDFYSKSNEARQILREIEIDLKNGSRINTCARQRKAAKLGIMANDSLINAFKINGLNPPTDLIKKSQKRWESILNQC